MALEVPSLYNFPPFFTLQPVEQTRLTQLNMWTKFALDFQKFHKLKNLSVHNDDLFSNSTLKRSLPAEGRQAVLNHIVETGFGLWETDEHDVCIASTKTIEEWSVLLYEWAKTIGGVGNMFTLYEIQTGDGSVGEEFYGIGVRLLYEAAKLLEKQGKAELLERGDLDETGVKFLAL